MLSHALLLSVLQQQWELPLDIPLSGPSSAWGSPGEQEEGHWGSSLSFVLSLPPTSAPCTAPSDLSPLPWMSFKGSSWG